MVYSTCSLNPIEDEAVVMEVLRRCGGQVHLVDVRTMYPQLRRMDGLLQWKVASETNEELPDFASVPESQRTLYRASMFPPSPEEAATNHLDRCMRVLPHHQNTGGFFLCVLEKTGCFETDASDPHLVATDLAAEDLCGIVKSEQQSCLEKGVMHRALNRGPKRERLVRWSDDQVKQQLIDFYGIDETFPWDCVFVKESTNHVRHRLPSQS